MSLLSKMATTRGGDKRPHEKNLKLQEKRLKELVDYARKYSPFYMRLYSGIGEAYTLSELPPVTKPQMMASFDDVLTDRNINMKRIDAFTSDIDNIGHKLDEKYLVFKTSGSTGVPAVILYDDNAIDVSSAVAAFRTFARPEDLKLFMKHGKKTAGVFADYGFYLACGMSRYLQLRMPRQNTKININVNAPEEEIISRLNEFQPAMLSGYPSNLALLADFKELDIHPDIVITGGELLTDEIRNKLEKRFGCYVQTHYSCTEGGEIACECSERHLHINEDWIIFEPVDKNNNPVPCGVMSDKVLITNLANRIQPFIRYELTDRVIVHDEKCKCGRTSFWVEVEGRTDDILEFEGDIRIAPMSLYKILEEVPGMSRFQLVQKASDKVELRLIADDKKKSFEYAKKALTDYFTEKGVRNMQIIMSDDDPRADKVSGKFKHICKDMQVRPHP